MKVFAPYRLDAVNQCLWRRDDTGVEERILLAPKAFEVFAYLVEHAGRLVTHDELSLVLLGIFDRPRQGHVTYRVTIIKRCFPRLTSRRCAQPDLSRRPIRCRHPRNSSRSAGS